MTNQLDALENRYLDLRNLLANQLNTVNHWLDKCASSDDQLDAAEFNTYLDRKLKLEANLQRIEAQLQSYDETKASNLAPAYCQ